MPLPNITQPHAAHAQPVMRQKTRLTETVKSVSPSLSQFIQKDLQHWKADLNERKLEGDYFLEWFSWRKPNPPESELAQSFQRLVGPELASLSRMIDSFSKGKGVSDMEQLLSAQQAYLQFCDRFDRQKQLILKKIDLKGNIRIY